MGTWMFQRSLIGAALTLFSFTTYAWESVPGEYVVKLKSSARLSSQPELSTLLGASVTRMIRDDLVLVNRGSPELAESGVRTLQENPFIESAEPNFIYHINRVPNDANFGNLWGMHNIGQADSQGGIGIAGIDINAEKAWDITTGSKDVVVAVIDTGVDFRIPDLKNNAWTNQAELNGKAGVDDDANGYIDDIHGYNFVANKGDSTDDHGHGSHCSGTIGGQGNDGQGVAGVNWDVRIMAVKFLDAQGSGTLANAVSAIDYARKNGAMIMSNSWAGGGYTDALKAAIDDAQKAGILFVAAAGNDGSDNDATPSYPASYASDNIISVAAINNRGELANFSNFGLKSVHIAAPGVNVFSTIPTGFDSWSGTSMATPHVTGVAALVLANEPHLDYTQLKTRLLATARPLYTLTGKIATGGMVDAYYALTNTIPPPDANDPANWSGSQALSLSTDHPYKPSVTQDFKVEVPGAKRIAIHFAKFETESNYDTVQFIDASGAVVATISGNRGAGFSPIINGSSATIRLTSDKSITKYGFDTDSVSFEQ